MSDKIDYEKMVDVRDMLPQSRILIAAAQECNKLACAAIELQRVLDDVDPTSSRYPDVVRRVNEAWAGVQLCMTELSCIDDVKVMTIMHVKNARWIGKLIRKRKEDDRILSAKRQYNNCADEMEDDDEDE